MDDITKAINAGFIAFFLVLAAILIANIVFVTWFM